MSQYKWSGLDEFENELERNAQIAEEMDEPQSYSFDDLFPNSFMRKYTQHSTFDEFLKNCGYPVNTQEQFDAIPANALDNYVKKTTSFSSWEDMQQVALNALFLRRIDLD